MSAIQQMLAGSSMPIYSLPTVVGTAVAGGNNSPTSFTIPAVAGAQAGDIAVVFSYRNEGATIPNGYNPLVNSSPINIHWLRLTGSDASTVMFVTGGTGVFVRAAKIIVRGGSNELNPFHINGDGAGGTGTSAVFGDTVEYAVNNTLYVGVLGATTSGGSLNFSGYSGAPNKPTITERIDSPFAVNGGVANLVLITADVISSGSGQMVTATASASMGALFKASNSIRIKGLPA